MTPSRFARARVAATGPGARATLVALADQAIVSGASFLTTILVGRAGGEGELGVYALAMSIVLLVVAAQDSLVSVPYSVFGQRVEPGERAVLGGSALVHHAALAASAGLAFLAAAAVLAVGPGTERQATIALALAAMAPLWLLREFVRQLAFAVFAVWSAFALDAVVVTLQLCGLAAVAMAGRLTAPVALAIVGLASGVGGLAFLARARRGLVVRRPAVLPDLARHGAFGRWVFADQAAGIVQGYAVHWILAFAIGVAATGRFAAALTIVFMANPLILGLVNVLGPRAARAWAKGGPRELRRVVFKASALLSTGMALIWIVLVGFGGSIVALVYGPEYAGLGTTVALLATAMVAWSLDVTAGSGLRAMGRPQPSFHSTLAAVAVTLPLAAILGESAGLTGGAAALLAGSVVRSAWRWVAFLRLSAI